MPIPFALLAVFLPQMPVSRVPLAIRFCFLPNPSGQLHLFQAV